MEAVQTKDSQAFMPLSQEAWQRLIEAGFLACDAGQHTMATDLFAQLAKLRADIPQIGVYQAMATLQCGQIAQAESLLRELRYKFPDSQMAKALLGVCRVLQEQPDGLSLLEDVLADGSEKDALAWAQLFIDQARRTQSVVKAPPAEIEGLQFFRHFNRGK
jgi:hypothetical protein